MSVLDAPAAALAWLGRQGTRAVALSVFAGIALPPLGVLLRPFFTETLIVLLCLAFLRVEPERLRSHFRRPGLVLAACAWIMLAVPFLFGGVLLALGRNGAADGLTLALTLQMVAPPITASPALAALIGFDSAIALASLIVCTAVTPLTAPLIAAALAGSVQAASPLALGLKLFTILAIAALAAALIRRIAGALWVERQRERIDGLSVIALFVFAVALMGDVGPSIVERPRLVVELIALAFLITLALMGLTALVFARAGWPAALALGLCAGTRNMGLMLAAAGSGVPELTWLYFALAQFPIYLLPQLLKPLARRVNNVG